jgi:agmatine/peptidylarginine deiminase
VDAERTPTADGFRMPAEWEPHEACLMSWPTRTSLWKDDIDRAQTEYAEVARAVSAFEPVTGWDAKAGVRRGHLRGSSR